MDQRRFHSIRENIDLYLFIILLSVLFHARSDEFAGKLPFLSTTGLSYLLMVYVGYKFGRLWGAVAGGVSAGYWFVMLVAYAHPTALQWLSAVSYRGEMLGPDWSGLTIMYASLQYVLLFAAIGYLAGWCADAVEARLARHHLKLEDLLPKWHGVYLHHIGAWVKRVIMAVFLLQVEGEDKKASILGRLRKLFVIIVTIPLLFSFSILGLRFSLPVSEHLTLVLPVLAPVIALWIAYAFGARQGVFAALGLLLIPLSATYVQELRHESGFAFKAGFGITTPDSVVALAAVAWVLGVVGHRLRDPEFAERLRSVFGGTPSYASAPRLKMWQMLLLALLACSSQYHGKGWEVYWDCYGILIMAAIWSGVLFDVRQTSNTILIVLGLGSLLNLYMPFWNSGFVLEYGQLEANEVVFLALVPFMVALFDIVTLRDARLLVATIYGLAWFADMAMSGGKYAVYPDFSLGMSIERVSMPLLSVAATLTLIELGARGLWVAARYRASAAVASASSASGGG